MSTQKKPHPHPPPPIHEQIKAAREVAGLSQQALADRINTGQPAVARAEAGNHWPHRDTLQAIADATGATFTIIVEPSETAAVSGAPRK